MRSSLRYAFSGVVFAAYALGAAPLAGCRSCSPEPASTEPAPDAGAAAEPTPRAPIEPTPTPENPPPPVPSVPPSTPPPTSAQPAAPPAPGVSASSEHALFATPVPVAQWFASLGAGAAVTFREAAESFVRCSAMSQVGACARLAGDDAADCSIHVAQVSHRSAGARGWFAVPALVQMAHAGGLSDTDLQRYAEAIETGNRALCAGLTAIADCDAVASGQPSACPATGERGCPRRVAEMSALRHGVTGAGTGVPDALRPYVTGVAGASACQAQFHAAIAVTAPAPSTN